MSSKEINTIFSKNLTYWLAQRNKTQADLAKQLNVSTAAASDWCNENKIPRTDKLILIADWLMIELSDLLQEKERTNNIMDSIIYRIKDDVQFSSLIQSIAELDKKSYDKVVDYVELLKK